MSDFSIGSKLIIRRKQNYYLAEILVEKVAHCKINISVFDLYGLEISWVSKGHKDVFLPTPELIQLAKNTKVRKLIGL